MRSSEDGRMYVCIYRLVQERKSGSLFKQYWRAECSIAIKAEKSHLALFMQQIRLWLGFYTVTGAPETRNKPESVPEGLEFAESGLELSRLELSEAF